MTKVGRRGRLTPTLLATADYVYRVRTIASTAALKVTLRVRYAAIALLAYIVLSTGHAAAQNGPEALQIESFDRALLSAMKLSQGRADALVPVVEQIFNFQVMTEFLVGVPWADMTEPDRAALVAAIEHYTVARLALRFDHFADQQFVVDPAVKERGLDRFVKTQFLSPGETPVKIDYRMREYDRVWKVIDVYSDGVSLLTTQRADVSSTLAAGGPAALIAKLRQTTDQLH